MTAELTDRAAAQFCTATRKAREYRLFAKSKAARGRVLKHMTDIVETINESLGKYLQVVSERRVRLRKNSLVAKRKLEQLHRTMRILLPQIRYWLRTGTVASQKILLGKVNRFGTSTNTCFGWKRIRLLQTGFDFPGGIAET